MSTSIILNFHNTPDEMFVALSRVFPVSEHTGTRWITVVADGVTMTYFKTKDMIGTSVAPALEAV